MELAAGPLEIAVWGGFSFCVLWTRESAAIAAASVILLLLGMI